MHMIFGSADAGRIIQAGWGECHPLAGQLNLPHTYLLVYPPRDEHELAVTARLLNAAVDHMAVPRAGQDGPGDGRGGSQLR